MALVDEQQRVVDGAPVDRRMIAVPCGDRGRARRARNCGRSCAFERL
ncbi:hypothetical protein [Streptosporangium vulgare]